MRGNRSSMSPLQIIDMHIAARKIASRSLPSHPKTRFEVCRTVWWNGDLVSEHYWLAQLRHRYGIGNAQTELRAGIKLAEKIAKYWRKWNHLTGPSLFLEPRYLPNGRLIRDLPPRIDGVHFRFATAAILSLIVGKQISPILLDVVPRTCDFGDIADDIHFLNYPDTCLVEILQLGRRPRRWKEIMNFAERRFKNTQIPDNFEAYAELIIRCEKKQWNQAVKAVTRCEELYQNRPQSTGDRTYFEAWEAPLRDAPEGIDLRLAALMKYGFRENSKQLKEVHSVHKW